MDAMENEMSSFSFHSISVRRSSSKLFRKSEDGSEDTSNKLSSNVEASTVLTEASGLLGLNPWSSTSVRQAPVAKLSRRTDRACAHPELTSSNVHTYKHGFPTSLSLRSATCDSEKGDRLKKYRQLRLSLSSDEASNSSLSILIAKRVKEQKNCYCSSGHNSDQMKAKDGVSQADPLALQIEIQALRGVVRELCAKFARTNEFTEDTLRVTKVLATELANESKELLRLKEENLRLNGQLSLLQKMFVSSQNMLHAAEHECDTLASELELNTSMRGCDMSPQPGIGMHLPVLLDPCAPPKRLPSCVSLPNLHMLPSDESLFATSPLSMTSESKLRITLSETSSLHSDKGIEIPEENHPSASASITSEGQTEQQPMDETQASASTVFESWLEDSRVNSLKLGAVDYCTSRTGHRLSFEEWSRTSMEVSRASSTPSNSEMNKMDNARQYVSLVPVRVRGVRRRRMLRAGMRVSCQ
eukprot:TRINITY_DN1609_c0_g1_i1.p1 TRINITY_DN1609_c0_g1~~TRINITY_DN1609_c0_g1_i1.p1  ORF type:complete len:472 (-),score=48.21 TRINITY_DN1609_c0_g1_i1:288-1703(-)